MTSYYWDDEDKMTKLEDSIVMNFKTDGLGFRRYKEVVGQSQTWFVYDLAASDTPGLAPLVAEYDGNGNLVAKYHHDGGGLLAMTRNNATSWHVFEAIGTVRQLVNAQSQVTDSYAFDAWGNELATQGNTVNPHRYVGKHGYYLDTQSALMLLGVRYYDAGVGRFLSVDIESDTYNWFNYVGNNPIFFIDPEGLKWKPKPPKPKEPEVPPENPLEPPDAPKLDVPPDWWWWPWPLPGRNKCFSECMQRRFQNPQAYCWHHYIECNFGIKWKCSTPTKNCWFFTYERCMKEDMCVCLVRCGLKDRIPRGECQNVSPIYPKPCVGKQCDVFDFPPPKLIGVKSR